MHSDFDLSAARLKYAGTRVAMLSFAILQNKSSNPAAIERLVWLINESKHP
jgi:hypothetical protein